MEKRNVVHALKPVLLLVIVQVANAWVNVLYKLALNDGMNLSVIVAYRYEDENEDELDDTVSGICMRVNWRSIASKLKHGSNLVNFSNVHNCHIQSHSSSHLYHIPFLRRLNLRTAGGKAKIIGTITGISGAMVLTFLKGPEIEILSFHINLFNNPNTNVVHPHASSGFMTIFGALASVGSNVSYALWLIIQAKMSERYPSPYSSTALMSLMGALLSVSYAFCVERDLTQWRLGWNIRLFTVAYAGIVVSGVMVAVISWCVRTRGPLFVSIFSPLMLVVVAFAGSTILDEKLYLGSIIGSVMIICGLYMVLWGKSKEMRKNERIPSESTDKFDTVEIMVKPGVEDKSNNILVNAVNGVGDNEDSWKNGGENNQCCRPKK
ncbi:hypothetical protein ACSQ67_013274 [Phaseolus vulgaris]